MLHGQLAVSLAHLLIGSRRRNLQYLVSLFECGATQAERRIYITDAETHSHSHLFQSVDFLCHYHTIGLGYLHQEVQQLQALAVVHVHGYLLSALRDGVLKRLRIRSIHLLALFEEVQKNLFPLGYCLLTKVGTQKLTYIFHFAVHDLIVCTDDVAGHYQQREQETITLSCRVLAVSLTTVGSSTVSSSAIAAIAIRLSTIGRKTTLIKHIIEERAQRKTCQCSQRPKLDESQCASYPFPYCHSLLYLLRIEN